MSLLSGSFRTAGCRQSNNGFLSMLNQVRHGGARPGGAPTFNWKQKQILRLAAKGEKKQTKIGLSGSFSDIKHLFEGVEKIDFNEDSDYELPSVDPDLNKEDDNPVKRIRVNLLFGSHKSDGYLPSKLGHGRYKFSHKRIFGEAKSPYYLDKKNRLAREKLEEGNSQ